MADLAGLSRRDVIRRGSHDLESRRTGERPDGCARRCVALRAVRGLARRVGVDVDEGRHHREIRSLVAVAAR